MNIVYKINRILCFLLSATMSFIFYSSLAGSSVFFFWFNGIIAVCFDIMRIELWDSKKIGLRVLACFFIAVSIIAFAGSSLAETKRATIREADNTYISILESDIKTLDDQIQIQGERVKSTSADYGTAAQKENEIYQELLNKKDMKSKELMQYKKDNKSDETVSSFDIYASALGIDVSVLMLWFFIVRAILLEISVLFIVEVKKDKKEIIEDTVKETQVSIDELPDIDTEPLKDKIEAWEKNAVQKHQEDNVTILRDIKDIVTNYEVRNRQAKLKDILKFDPYTKGN